MQVFKNYKSFEKWVKTKKKLPNDWGFKIGYGQDVIYKGVEIGMNSYNPDKYEYDWIRYISQEYENEIVIKYTMNKVGENKYKGIKNNNF